MKKKSEDFQNLYIFPKDMDIYKEVITRKRVKPKSISTLHKLNMLLCRELYLIIYIIETVYKNKLHRKMTEVHQTENWFNLVQWNPEELKFLTDAAKSRQTLTSPVRILNEVSLKFWVKTFESSYEQTLFIPAIMYLFPNYDNDEPFRRSKLRKIFSELLTYRNNVSHYQIIIHEGRKLLNYYHKFLKLIYWMDKDYYHFAIRQSNFMKYYYQLFKHPKSIKGLYYSLQRSIKTHLWNFMEKHPQIFHIEKEKAETE